MALNVSLPAERNPALDHVALQRLLQNGSVPEPGQNASQMGESV